MAKTVFTAMIKGLLPMDNEEKEEIKFVSLDIEVFHDDCHNGRVHIDKEFEVRRKKQDLYRWGLTCQRCGAKRELDLKEDERIAFIETFFDGQERKLEREREYNYMRSNIQFRVVHRNYHGERCQTCGGTGWVMGTCE